MAAPGEVLVPQQVMEGQGAQDPIADNRQLEAFAREPDGSRPPLTPRLRGVLAEAALRGVVRYDWALLQPLVHAAIDEVLADFAAETADEVGPSRPMPGGEDVEAAAPRLHALVAGFEGPPFTYQRLCEVLLEPRKQYSRIDKLVAALEKVLSVTSTLPRDAAPPPPPLLGELAGVNDNPPNPPQQHDPAAAQAWPALNGQADGGPGRSGPGGGGPGGGGPGIDSFSFFMHAEIVTPRAGGAAAGVTSPPSPAPLADPAEVAHAEAFVAAALADASGAAPLTGSLVRHQAVPSSPEAQAAAQSPGRGGAGGAPGGREGSPQAASSPPAAPSPAAHPAASPPQQQQPPSELHMVTEPTADAPASPALHPAA